MEEQIKENLEEQSGKLVVDYKNDERVPLEESHLLQRSSLGRYTSKEVEERAQFLIKYYNTITGGE